MVFHYKRLHCFHLSVLYAPSCSFPQNQDKLPSEKIEYLPNENLNRSISPEIIQLYKVQKRIRNTLFLPPIVPVL
jgi:hypothetical protein